MMIAQVCLHVVTKSVCWLTSLPVTHQLCLTHDVLLDTFRSRFNFTKCGTPAPFAFYATGQISAILDQWGYMNHTSLTQKPAPDHLQHSAHSVPPLFFKECTLPNPHPRTYLTAHVIKQSQPISPSQLHHFLLQALQPNPQPSVISYR